MGLAKKGLFSLEKILCYSLSVLVASSVILAIVVVVNSSEDLKESKNTIFTWGYQCSENKCVRVQITTDNEDAVDSLPVCNLKCVEFATLLPQPTGETIISRSSIVSVNATNIILSDPAISNQMDYWKENLIRFQRVINSKVTEELQEGDMNLRIDIKIENNSLDFKMTTNESYILNINVDGNTVVVEITGATYFGARHGLESLGQLIVYDEFSSKLVMPSIVEISDSPVYPHRGILLDTVRHYYSIDAIKRTIDAMALVKLNVFHWHITDSQSFPMVLKSHPEFARIGAYAPKKIYMIDDMVEIVNYGKMRGVRVMPEFDAPSHVGEGWQFTDWIVCYNAQPWENYCVGPPCGQLDPTKNSLYDLLKNIYEEMFEIFATPDLFHMGGDEVTSSCWNVSSDIQNWMLSEGWKLEESYFIELWNYFQNRALDELRKVNSDSRVVLWTSSLTEEENVDNYLNNKDYIIHVWTSGTGADSHVPHLLEKGYDLIMSNYDSFYFDCGFGSWVAEGNNWCAPYKGWHKVYNNNLANIAGQYKNQILGGEACLWSSLSGEQTLDSRLWPRASALAERLWSEPNGDFRGVETRILLHRQYLVLYGINAESIQPEWCLLHEKDCPIS